MLKNRYPIFVVSKGRWGSRLTMKALDRLGADYWVIVEVQEFDQYAEHIRKERLLVLPQMYLDNYETCDDLGDSVSKGPGAARNFAMDISRGWGFKRHWVMDDNLDDFHRLHNNMKIPVRTCATLRAAEDFTDRFSNVPISGFNYYSFCKTTDQVPPFVLNTRIYSCLLMNNFAGYKWRGRYNEDTDICLRVLKDGYCTIQFNAFLCGKVTTQRMRGGKTKEFYEHEGTLPKSQMLADLHPDVAKVVWRFNRHHHHVDYGPFKNNRLKYVDGFQPVAGGINNYGMKLVDYGKGYSDKKEKACTTKENTS